MTNKNMRGGLFPNRKRDGKNDPDWRGDGMVCGVSIDIAAWERTTKKGSKMLSLSFSEPRERKPKDTEVAPEIPKDPPPAAGAVAEGELPNVPF